MQERFKPALAGVRVLELGSSVAGPSAARLLGDLGADVLKVEPPEGDGLRQWGPAAPGGESWWFKSHNRSKRFVQLDLHDPADRATVREMIVQCDVLIENFRPGRMGAWGLGYDDVRELNPRIIYASISGYGQDGPYSQRVGFGNIAESMGGLRYLTGFPDRPPVRIGVSIGDELAALYTVIGVTAALHARERDGVGDHVDVSLLESVFSLIQAALPEFGATGAVRERQGNTYLAAAPSGVWPTRDGKYLAIGANADAIFRRFVSAMAVPELADDPRFSTNRARTEHHGALDAIIAAWCAQQEASAASDLLAKADVPAGPIYSIADIASDPHVRARGDIVTIADECGVTVSSPGPVPRFANHTSTIGRAAGAIGRDTEAVFAELGIHREGPRA